MSVPDTGQTQCYTYEWTSDTWSEGTCSQPGEDYYGQNGNLLISVFELLSAADFDTWLDTVQGTIFGKVVVLLDSCRSGSFVADLIPPSGRERGVVTSSAFDLETMFASSGTLSLPSQTTVTVPAGAPIAATGNARAVGSGTATLNGTVNPKGAATPYSA